MPTLAHLEEVGEMLFIRQNPLLEHLGLDALTDVGMVLSIEENDALLTLTAPALESVGHDVPAHYAWDGFVSAEDNPLLPSCYVDLIAERLAENPPPDSIQAVGNGEGVCE